jgi:hypothetical protein
MQLLMQFVLKMEEALLLGVKSGGTLLIYMLLVLETLVLLHGQKEVSLDDLKILFYIYFLFVAVENSILGKFTGAQNHEVNLVCDPSAGTPGSLVSVGKDTDLTWLLTWNTSVICTSPNISSSTDSTHSTTYSSTISSSTHDSASSSTSTDCPPSPPPIDTITIYMIVIAVLETVLGIILLTILCIILALVVSSSFRRKVSSLGRNGEHHYSPLNNNDDE